MTVKSTYNCFVGEARIRKIYFHILFCWWNQENENLLYIIFTLWNNQGLVNILYSLHCAWSHGRDFFISIYKLFFKWMYIHVHYYQQSICSHVRCCIQYGYGTCWRPHCSLRGRGGNWVIDYVITFMSIPAP